MIRIVILAAAIAPPLAILSYWTARISGSWRSEAVWSAFFLGALGTIGAMILEVAVDPLGRLVDIHPVTASAAEALFVAAIPEESIKFFILVVLAEKHVDVRRFQDVIILGLAVSLGFATLENFFYVTTVENWKTVAALRAVTSVPGHGIDGLAMGALWVSARLNGLRGIRAAIPALAVPVLLHAAYDFPLFVIKSHIAKVWFGSAWILIVIISFSFVIRLSRRVFAEAVSADHISPRGFASREKAHRLMSAARSGWWRVARRRLLGKRNRRCQTNSEYLSATERGPRYRNPS